MAKIEAVKEAELFAVLAFVFLLLLGARASTTGHQEQDTRTLLPLVQKKDTRGTTTLALIEDEGFRFPSGSADLSPAFRFALKTNILPHVRKVAVSCGCNALTVIGHTDRVPLQPKRSTLDTELIDAFAGRPATLFPGSNVDLGMMRALAIIRYLESAQVQGLLPQKGEPGYIKYFIPYSAGAMIRTDFDLERDGRPLPEQRRRRIELRLERSSNWGLAP